MAAGENTQSNVGVRDWLNQNGYSVQWNGSGKPITAISSTGRQISIPTSNYSLSPIAGTQNATAMASPSYLQSLLGQTASGSPVGVQESPNMPGQYTSAPATPTYTPQASSLVPLRSTVEGAGGQVNWEGTGQPIGVTLNGKAYQVPANEYQLVSQPGSQNATAEVSQQYMQQLLGDPQQQINDTMANAGDPMDPSYWTTVVNSVMQQYASLQSQMGAIISQYGAAGAAALNSYQAQFQNALNTISQAAAQQNAQSSPAVQASIAILQQQNAVDNKNLNEELAARGLAQSGIGAYEQGQLQQNLTNQENQLLGNWTAQQQQNQYNAAMTEAQMEGQFAGNYAQMEQQVAEQPLQMESQLAQTGFNVASSLQQWAASGEASAYNAYQQRMLDEEKMQQSWNEFAANYGLKQQSNQALDEYRNAEIDLRNQQMQYTALHDQTMEGLQQLRVQIAANNSGNKSNPIATSAALGQATDTTKFKTRDQAIAYAQANSQIWAGQGVDMNQVYSGINAVYGSASTSSGVGFVWPGTKS